VPPPAAIASATSGSVNPATVCTMREAGFVTAGEAVSLGAGAEDASVGSGAGACVTSEAEAVSVEVGSWVGATSLADGARVGSVVG
jgi:hypothetical protein